MVFFAAALRITENHFFHCYNFLRVHGHVGIKWRDFNRATPAMLTSLVAFVLSFTTHFFLFTPVFFASILIRLLVVRNLFAVFT